MEKLSPGNSKNNFDTFKRKKQPINRSIIHARIKTRERPCEVNVSGTRATQFNIMILGWKSPKLNDKMRIERMQPRIKIEGSKDYQEVQANVVLYCYTIFCQIVRS